MRFGKSGTNFKVRECRSNFNVELVDCTNCESGPGSGVVAGEYVFGVVDGDVDIDIVYTIADGTFLAIAPGTSYSVVFYPDKGTVGSNIAGTLSVGGSSFVSSVRGLTTLRVTGKFNGGFTPTLV